MSTGGSISAFLTPTVRPTCDKAVASERAYQGEEANLLFVHKSP